MSAIEDIARDQRLVGVAFEELDQYLHPDAGDDHAAPAIAGPVLADPAAHRISAVQIPVKLHQDAAVFVAVDLALAHDHGRLRALHHRPRGAARRQHRGGSGHQHIAPGKGIVVAFRARAIPLGHEMMRGREANIVLARARRRVARKLKAQPARQRHAIPQSPVAPVRATLLIDAQPGQRLAHAVAFIVTRIVEALDLALGI